MEKKEKQDSFDLEHLTFVPGEEVYLHHYAHMGECVDLFEALSGGCDQEKIDFSQREWSNGQKTNGKSCENFQ